MDMQIREAFDEQIKAWKVFRDVNDARLAKLEAGQGGVAALDTKLERINAALDTQRDTVEKRIDGVEAELNRAVFGGGGAHPTGNQAFAHLLRTGQDSDYLATARDGVTTSDKDGGYLVPENVSYEIARIAEKNVVMRQLAAVQRISVGNSFEEFVTRTGAGAFWVAETAARPKTDTPELASIKTEAHEMYANPQASQRLLDDSAVNVESWLAGELGIAFAEEEGSAFISGTGIGKPKGILAYTTVLESAWEWDKIGHVVTGTAGGFGTSNQADSLINLVHALKSKYRQGGNMILNRKTLGEVRKFKTDLGYLWQPSLQAGTPSLLLGYPVNEDDAMPDIAAGTLPIAFGDFGQGYRIVDHVGVRLLRDPYSNKPFVGFYVTKRVGGGVRNFEAIKLLRVAA